MVDTIYKDNTIAIDTIYEYTVAAVNSENLEGNKSAVESVTVSGSYRISDTLFTADGTIQSITTDKNGKHIVYVRKKTRTTNGYSYKVERYGQNGEFLNSWDIPNSFEEMHFSNKIAVDDSGFIYVADPLNKILKFDSSGTIIKQLELSWQCDVRCLSIFKDTLYIADMFSQKVYAYSTSGDSLFSWGGKGFTDGRFENVNGIICDPSGMIYVEDFLDESRVQVFDNEGTFIRSFRSSDLGISIISSVKDSLILLTGSNMYGCDLNGTLKFAIYSVPSPVKAFLDQSNKLTVALWSGEVVHLVRN